MRSSGWGVAASALLSALIHRSTWEGRSPNFAPRAFSEVAGLYLELLGPEGLPEPLPGGLHELGMAHDLADLLPGEVAAHVVLLERLLKGHVALVHAVDEVAHDLLLALGEGGGFRAAEEPLPEGRSLAHIGPNLLRSRSLPVDPILTHRKGSRARGAPFDRTR
jgi:hypothetical protein